MELLVTFFSELEGRATSFQVPFFSGTVEHSPLSLLGQDKIPYSVRNDCCYQLQFGEIREEVPDDIPIEGKLSIASVQLFVNGQFVESIWTGEKLMFPSVHGNDNCIFLDCFAFVELTLVVHFKDKSRETFSCDALSVLVREDSVSRSVEAMADYVFEKEERLLMRGSFREKDFGGQGQGLEEDNLETSMALAEEILVSYEMNLPYFQSNCRFKMEQVDLVDRCEKLQQVTPKTIAYMVQHPEFLKKVSGRTGIAWGNQMYLPEKTLVTQAIYSKDIYENKVVVSFLHCIQLSLEEMLGKVKDLCFRYQVEPKETSSSVSSSLELLEESSTKQEYIPSHRCILDKMTEVLVEHRDKISYLLERFREMTLQYHKIMSFPLEYWTYMEDMPKPTPILLSVPPYHRIFLAMNQWFSQSTYDFGKERAMLSYLNVSDLYEHYLLVKFVDFFLSEGWTQVVFSHVKYGSGREEHKEHSQDLNCFEFKKEDEMVTLFYQPNIYDSDRNDWNDKVGLYRNNNNSIRMDREELATGNYYQPDFVFKIQSSSGVRYVIADGKFSTLYRVKQYYLMPLLYKYLFSLSPVNPQHQVSGLAVFYGKCQGGEEEESAYNKQIYPIRPFTELFPVVEGVDVEGHGEFLRKMLQTE